MGTTALQRIVKHQMHFALVGRYLTRCWSGAPSAVLSTSRDGPSRFVTTLNQLEKLEAAKAA